MLDHLTATLLLLLFLILAFLCTLFYLAETAPWDPEEEGEDSSY